MSNNLQMVGLGALGLAGTEISWFTSYLSNRVQLVKYNGSYSSWGLVRSGIPQGSALGPLLFLVYMNNMSSQIVHGRLLQYADDTALICSGPTMHGCCTQTIVRRFDSHFVLDTPE